MSRLGVYKIQGQDYDLDDLTLNEMAEIEQLSGGKRYSELDFGGTDELKALVFVLLKRSSTDIRFEDIGETRMVDFLQPEEKMPPLPPDSADSLNGSVRDDSGTRPSVGSTPG